MKNKQYCIFNKQYTKDVREETVARLATKMTQEGVRGHFLPPSLSAFGYNETRAHELFPMTATEAEQYGYSRHTDSAKAETIGGYNP